MIVCEIIVLLLPHLWLKFCRLPTIQQDVQQRKLLYMGLYLLIWGEAANLRFMPECLCYIYHHVCFQIVSSLDTAPTHICQNGNRNVHQNDCHAFYTIFEVEF